MVHALKHRGTQGLGLRIDGSIGLAQLNNGIERNGEWGERAPGLSIAADARLDNRGELIAALGVSAESPSDATLILLSYERWGCECPRYLLGDFAFAVWDHRQRLLFCARDHLGIKPFYYVRTSRMFAFASELKALLALDEVPRQLNEAKVADYLLALFNDPSNTFYRDIVRLPPGHTVRVTGEDIRIERYWALDTVPDLRLESDEAYAEAYRDCFTEAVRCRLGEPDRTGTFLSGGLDSSSITCVAKRLLAERRGLPLPTFSAIFPRVPQCDEQSFIQAVLNEGGFEAHFVRADELGPLTSMGDILQVQHEPFFGPNLFIHQAIYRAASERGVRVLLDGIDGDTTVSHGLASLAEQARTGEWRSLWANVRGLARHSNQSSLAVARKYILSPLTPPTLRQGWRRLRGCRDPVCRFNPTIRRDFAERIGVASRCAAYDAESMQAFRSEREHHRQHWKSGIVPFVLEILDRAATMFGIDARYPFFDKRLVELCYAVPSAQKLSDGWTRLIARRAMNGILPDTVEGCFVLNGARWIA
jgi:asparagine synthase (glutamine-hydrolysing)